MGHRSIEVKFSKLLPLRSQDCKDKKAKKSTFDVARCETLDTSLEANSDMSAYCTAKIISSTKRQVRLKRYREKLIKNIKV
jgi:hypothetical protein